MALGNKTLDDLLNPITQQLGRQSVADSVTLPVWEHTPKRVTDGMGQAELVDLFIRESEKIRVQVRRCTHETLTQTIAAIVAQGKPDSGESVSVVCADDDLFASVGLVEAVADVAAVTDVCVWDAAKGEANVEAALAATYGITRTAAAIAETGTIVQPTSTRCGRAISLLPLVHIAVVEASTIVPTMLEVMKGYAGQEELSSQICLISGPSATSDIELVRVEGVHGPMYVYYVVVE